jgi:hypothetical protein
MSAPKPSLYHRMVELIEEGNDPQQLVLALADIYAASAGRIELDAKTARARERYEAVEDYRKMAKVLRATERRLRQAVYEEAKHR